MDNKKGNPPGIWLIRFFANEYDHDSLIGDISEMYDLRCGEKGRFNAGAWYLFQVMRLLPLLIIQSATWSMIMLKNYLTVALRSIRRNKFHSLLNISGLALGLTCCLLMLLWVTDELSYDRFHENGKDIYRVYDISSKTGDKNAVTPIPFAPKAKDELPEIIAAARLSFIGKLLFTFQGTSLLETNGIYADEDFLKMFTFPLSAGDRESALNDPYSIIISENMADKFFGDKDPVGESLMINSRVEFKITGVFEDIPDNSHLKFNFIWPFKVLEKFGAEMGNWNDVSYFTYIQIHENADPAVAEQKADALFQQNKSEGQNDMSLLLQPLYDVYLKSADFYYNSGRIGNYTYVYIFGVAAILVLIIASINFVNLTTARSGRRAKEIGMRKVTGAHRSDIIKQFFGESIFQTMIASLFAVGAVVLLIPVFNSLSGKEIQVSFETFYLLLPAIAGATILAGLVSGIYPALYISRFSPAGILKGSFNIRNTSGVTGTGRGSSLKKALVIVQFSASIVLIAGTITVYKQVNYMLNRDLGYDREMIFYARTTSNINKNFAAFSEQLKQNPGVEQVSRINNLPTQLGSGTSSAKWEGMPDDRSNTQFQIRSVDYNYLELFNSDMAEGRFFSKDFVSDSANFVINETAVKAMGLEDPVGKQFYWGGNEGTIIGVIKDFNFRSLHNEVNPMFMLMLPERYHFLLVKISPQNRHETLAYCEQVWEEFSPEYPFEYVFLDDSVEALYRTEMRIGKIFGYLTVMTIVIACLGLFGLASFTAEQRTKEIGIRKVLGAKESGIVALLSKEFIIWVLIGGAIALPVSWYLMNKWLEGFAYRTDVQVTDLVLAIAGTLLIALVTTSFQAVRAARANPVQSLKYE